MEEDKKNSDFIKEQEESGNAGKNILRGFVDGTLLTRGFFTRQMPFVFFVSFIGLIYISNQYHADRTRNNISRLKNELMELRSEALYTSSELMKMGRQTEVAREVNRKGLDLKEALKPPKKIEIR